MAIVGDAMTPALMDAHEAAERLFGSRSRANYKRVLRLIHANQLEYVQLKKRYWVWRKPLEALLGGAKRVAALA